MTKDQQLKRRHLGDLFIAVLIGLTIAAFIATIGITIAAAVIHSDCNHVNQTF